MYYIIYVMIAEYDTIHLNLIDKVESFKLIGDYLQANPRAPVDLNKYISTLPDVQKENIVRTILRQNIKFPWQNNEDNSRDEITEEDEVAQQSNYLVPSTLLFKTLSRFDMI